MLADEESNKYFLFVELGDEKSLGNLAEMIETELRRSNCEYDDKRASGRLQALEVRRFQNGAGQAIKNRFLTQGVRETQYKPPVLVCWKDWAEWIDKWAEKGKT